MSIIDYSINTFDYFKTLNPLIDSGTVLDYGSNYGMFLDSSRNRFNHTAYTGIDVSQEAINYGKNKFPLANFIHSNHYNLIYNPKGTCIRPKIDLKFNSIISYSVLTHTTVEDMIDSIQWLYSHLENNGTLLVSFLDVDDPVTRNYFFKKRCLEYKTCDTITTNTYVYLCNNRVSQIPYECQYFLLFFNKLFLKSIIPYDCKLLSAPSNILGCFQSCIEIKK